MEALLQSLVDFLAAGWGVLVELGRLAAPQMPLLIGLVIWVAIWMFAVNWVKLREVLLRGGFIAVLLIAVVTVFVWGTIAPPEDGVHSLFGLRVSNYVGKTVYVTGLVCIMFLSGAVQLSGCCGSLQRFEEEATEPSPSHAPH